MGDVVEQRLAAPVGQRVARLRLALNEALLGGDVARLLEFAQMDAGIAVGRSDRVADDREVHLAGAGEKSDDGDPDATVQHLVDGVVVEVGHVRADAGRLRHNTIPGNASSTSMSAADSSSTSMRWRSA